MGHSAVDLYKVVMCWFSPSIALIVIYADLFQSRLEEEGGVGQVRSRWRSEEAEAEEEVEDLWRLLRLIS